MNIAEALGVKFPLVMHGQRTEVLGINMLDTKLTDYRKSEKVPDGLKMAAGLLLQYTTATLVEGKTVRQTIEQPAPAAPVALKSTPKYVAPTPPPQDMGPSDWDTFDQMPPDDGFPPPGVAQITCRECGAPIPMHVKGCSKEETNAAVAATKQGVQRVTGTSFWECIDCGSSGKSREAVVHAANCKPGEATRWEEYYSANTPPEWAKRLERKTDAILESFAGLLGALQSHQTQPAPAAGGGHTGGGGGSLHIVKVKVTPKDGKVGIDFYDDDPDHKYPEVRETRKAARWANTLPKGFDISDEQIHKVDWDLVYKLSSNLTEKGNPYKDVVSITPRK